MEISFLNLVRRMSGYGMKWIKGLDDKYIELFGLVFCLFWFNRNIETFCFGIEAKQPKQTSFGCFESKLVSKDTLLSTHLFSHWSIPLKYFSKHWSCKKILKPSAWTESSDLISKAFKKLFTFRHYPFKLLMSPVPEFIEPRFRGNKPKTLVSSHRQRAFWACFRENCHFLFNYHIHISNGPMCFLANIKDAKSKVPHWTSSEFIVNYGLRSHTPFILLDSDSSIFFRCADDERYFHPSRILHLLGASSAIEIATLATNKSWHFRRASIWITTGQIYLASLYHWYHYNTFD